MIAGADPLILTATLDPASRDRVQRLRDTHFPSRLNIVPAHLTLFHALPGAALPEIATALASATAAQAPMPFRSTGWRFLGRGVAAEIDAPGLGRLRASLVERWQAELTAQDRQGFRPHVTVQNKVSAEEARMLHATLSAGSPLPGGTVTGLSLWHYRGGPWEAAGDFPFAA